ncbi:GNAT family N-acetyltransferase [Parachlamydia sp.]|uniref:GNAT family N-acetyltransferase n=1 Tax=Parachlamydia sp. TaxID=2052048 RepID=UPI003D0A8CE6
MTTTSLAPAEILYNDGNVSLVIRPLRKDDASTLNTAVQESLDNLLPFMDWAHAELSEKNQFNRIITSNQKYLQGSEYDFAVFDTLGNFLVSASWHPSKTRNKKCFEIGYWTHTKHCNKGLATLVIKILTVAAFEFMKCDRVEIGCNKANNLSKKVIEKCDFIFEGEIRNYFSKPTDKMLENNYSSERTYLIYGLTNEDLSKISWYSEINKHVKIS